MNKLLSPRTFRTFSCALISSRNNSFSVKDIHTLHVSAKFDKFKRTFCKKDFNYSQVANNTLEVLYDQFDSILENQNLIADPDITLNDGVLTVKLGIHGTYVINKQTPNQQIWLSSPFSGPKRYDYVNGNWLYKHENQTLFDLLNEEFRSLFQNSEIDFNTLQWH